MTTRAPEEEARAAAGAAPEEGARRAARMRGCVRGAGGAGGQQVAGHSQAAMKVTMPVMSSAVLYFSLIAETRDQKKIVEAIMHASEKLSTLYTVWYWPGGAGRASSTCAGLVGGRSV